MQSVNTPLWRHYGSAALVTMIATSSTAIAQDNADGPVVELDTMEVVSEGIATPAYVELEKEPSVGKMNVPVQDQPYSISIVDQDFIQDTGAKSIQDALLYTPGVYAGNFGFDTRIDSANVRGVSAGRYLDGLRQIYGSYNSVRSNIYVNRPGFLGDSLV